jgi:flagellar basal body-associated protein FliL
MADTDFKDAVKAYVILTDEIQKSSLKMRELRKQKDAVGETILEYMKRNAIDELQMQDGKLVRKKCKRVETLKKEHILAELKSVVDDTRAEAMVTNIFSHRSVTEKDTLSRTILKNGVAIEDDVID